MGFSDHPKYIMPIRSFLSLVRTTLEYMIENKIGRSGGSTTTSPDHLKTKYHNRVKKSYFRNKCASDSQGSPQRTQLVSSTSEMTCLQNMFARLGSHSRGHAMPKPYLRWSTTLSFVIQCKGFQRSPNNQNRNIVEKQLIHLFYIININI